MRLLVRGVEREARIGEQSTSRARAQPGYQDERDAASEGHDHPPIDRDLAETVWPMILEQKDATARLTAEEFQALFASGVAPDARAPNLDRDGGVRVTETTIDSASGEQRLPVLVVKPSSGSGPFPCVYHTANGGKMLQPSTADMAAAMSGNDAEPRWVEDFGVAFVIIAPRVGPEHPHPAQVEDAYAGLQWLVENAEELGVDPAASSSTARAAGAASRPPRRSTPATMVDRP